jgi:voltage-gated potassium channel Kch
MQPLVIGIVVFAFSVLVQSTAAAAGVALLEAMIRRGHAQGSFWNITFVLQLMVFLLLGAHLVQMACWALVFIWCGQFRDFEAAFCHSAVNYTTLGYGEVVMARPWRLLGAMEAMDGMLMAGVSAAILFAVLHRLVERRLAEPQAGNRPVRAEPGRSRLADERQL